MRTSANELVRTGTIIWPIAFSLAKMVGSSNDWWYPIRSCWYRSALASISGRHLVLSLIPPTTPSRLIMQTIPFHCSSSYLLFPSFCYVSGSSIQDPFRLDARNNISTLFGTLFVVCHQCSILRVELSGQAVWNVKYIFPSSNSLLPTAIAKVTGPNNLTHISPRWPQW